MVTPRRAALWFVVSTLLLIAPVYSELGNRIEPRVAGLPWSLVWVLGVISLNFGALVWLYRARIVDSDEPDEVEPP